MFSKHCKKCVSWYIPYTIFVINWFLLLPGLGCHTGYGLVEVKPYVYGSP